MTDDDLRDRMRHADPAASLAPLPPDRVARLLEETVSTAPPHRRPLLPALAAAAAVLLLAGVGWLILRPRPEPTVEPVAKSPASAESTSTAPAEVRLTAPDGSAAKCRPPRADFLRSTADFAFAGTVTGIDAMVTLKVTKVYEGAPATTVRIDPPPDTSETMMGSGRFETGKNYLIAASEGQVMICGYSGEADAPGLLDLFDQAF